MMSRRLIPSLYRLALSLLCVAVLFWGTEYKLSLYHPPAQRQVETAKLLSEAERTPSVSPFACAHSGIDPASQPNALGLTQLAVIIALAASLERISKAGSTIPRKAHFTHNAISRPPPSRS